MARFLAFGPPVEVTVIIIAERLNATRPRVARALADHDEGLIAGEAVRQAEAGADFVDVNAGSTPDLEVENLKWMARVVQEATDVPLCLDSSNTDALRGAAKLVRGDRLMLNSVTGEKDKIERVMPLAAETGADLVALAMDEQGLLETAEHRVEVAAKLVEAAGGYGIGPERLFIDPCVQPLSTSPAQAMEALSAVFQIMRLFPGIHTTCGLSNISFGLPNRRLINTTYLACLIMAGLDSVVCDPTTQGLREAVLVGEALAGRDEFCMNYVMAMK